MPIQADDPLLSRVTTAKRESTYLDFKREFNPSSKGDWCELIKDIVAMANSGGGVIAIGLNNGGTPSGIPVTDVLNVDDAVFLDKIRKYTSTDLVNMSIHEMCRDSHTIACIRVYKSSYPVVFTSPGTYPIDNGRQKSAFSAGTIYFRHGAKSEIANQNDLRKFVERRVEEIRTEWLSGVRKIITAPEGAHIAVLNSDSPSSPDGVPIRLVKDSAADGFQLIDPDTTHPYRQKELLQVLNANYGLKVTSHDIVCIKHCIPSLTTDQTYCYTSKFSSTRYSDAFAERIANEIKQDGSFLVRCREMRKLHLRNKRMNK